MANEISAQVLVIPTFDFTRQKEINYKYLYVPSQNLYIKWDQNPLGRTTFDVFIYVGPDRLTDDIRSISTITTDISKLAISVNDVTIPSTLVDMATQHMAAQIQLTYLMSPYKMSSNNFIG